MINKAQTNKRKCVCFVTGVPGAGKTLVGLDVVAKNMDEGKKNLSVYLSGNGPLVEVLREALKRSVKAKKQFNRETEAAINTLIQSSYAFKKDNASHNHATPENILIFDEAQRVWNKEKMSSKHKENPLMAVSEPHLLWFRCGIEDFKEWELYYSPEIFGQVEDKNINREMIEGCDRCHPIPELHLKTSIRSFRADKQCQFVDALLDNKPVDAKEVYNIISEKYPIYITRDYETAKNWVRNQVRGSQRSGVLACSSAQRLKPEGIYVPTEIDVKNWFLAPSDDLRSSNMLEIVASEFKVQGLEIDWAIVCWDADLRRKEGKNDWDYYSFRGTRWNRRNKPEQKRYLLNSYRVLLTRARQGMIIFVPKGVDPEVDETRNSEYYDNIYSYLLKCGIEELSDEKRAMVNKK